MGLFDPAHQKILAKAPPTFKALMTFMEPRITSELKDAGISAIGLDQSRTVIYSGLLLSTEKHFGPYSKDCIEFATRVGSNAARSYPKMHRPAVQQIMTTIAHGLDEAESDNIS